MSEDSVKINVFVEINFFETTGDPEVSDPAQFGKKLQSEVKLKV